MTRIASKKILEYKGELTFDIIEDILAKFKENMQDIDIELVIRKRLYSILVESLENTYRHNCEVNSTSNHQSVELQLITRSDAFELIIGNYLPNSKTDELAEKIDLINSLDLVGLNRLYRASISKARISDKGGAGLGLIEIARNSRQQISYRFDKEHDKYSYVELKINISKNPNKLR